MKRLICFVVFVLSVLQSYAISDKGFEIRFQFKNVDTTTILVTERIPNPTAWFIDTLYMVKGEVIYKGKVDYPRMMTFCFNKGEEFYGSVCAFVDNSKITIKGDYLKLNQTTVKGGKAHNEYCEIERHGKEIFKKYNNVRHARSKAFKNNKRAYDSLSVFYEKAYDDVFNFLITRPNYADSEVLPFYISEYFNVGSLNKLEKALNGFNADIQKNAYVLDQRQAIEKDRKTRPGEKAFDFTLKDLAGNCYRLSDFKGKYVLLEFSASWCGWCKLEIPFLQKVYENTKDKNFVMFTICLDESREKWEKDVKEHNLPWKVLSDLQGFKGDLTTNYNVGGIPVIYLINPEGIIEKKDLRRDEMISYINNLF